MTEKLVIDFADAIWPVIAKEPKTISFPRLLTCTLHSDHKWYCIFLFLLRSITYLTNLRWFIFQVLRRIRPPVMLGRISSTEAQEEDQVHHP